MILFITILCIIIGFMWLSFNSHSNYQNKKWIFTRELLQNDLFINYYRSYKEYSKQLSYSNHLGRIRDGSDSDREDNIRADEEVRRLEKIKNDYLAKLNVYYLDTIKLDEMEKEIYIKETKTEYQDKLLKLRP
jgi:hypothetical protein